MSEKTSIGGWIRRQLISENSPEELERRQAGYRQEVSDIMLSQARRIRDCIGEISSLISRGKQASNEFGRLRNQLSQPIVSPHLLSKAGINKNNFTEEIQGINGGRELLRVCEEADILLSVSYDANGASQYGSDSRLALEITSVSAWIDRPFSILFKKNLK